MKPKKLFGWLLLIMGLLLIFWTLYSTYSIFTNKKPAPEIFKMEEESSPALQEDIEDMIKEQLKGLIPQESIPKFFNLIAWTVLAGILIFGGSKVSIIGINLLKE